MAGRVNAKEPSMAEEIANRDEARMIASILDGDVQLYHQLIRPYERSVYVMSLSYMKNETDAENVAQEAFLKPTVTSRVSVARPSSAHGWWASH